ncbi:ATP-binding protein [Lachnospiraceae bacterium NSJ-29]|uniref:ATP-binding protein n=2 Tax=Wansuia hejianensis TaxID=2763667 RepID=A0A926EZZ3_9FIRM|nr:ATP-binding protein [Wansuia hejianensis]
MDVIIMDFTYNGSICSDLGLIKNFVDNILKKLNSIIDNKDTIFDIRLIMNELIINGVFHGNHCIDTKCVNLSLDVQKDRIIISVKDEGEGIDFDINTYDPLDLKCGGRGLVLVHGLSDELIVNENQIIAIKYIS